MRFSNLCIPKKEDEDIHYRVIIAGLIVKSSPLLLLLQSCVLIFMIIASGRI